MSYHVMSCHVMSCHVMSCHVTSCHVMSCHVMSGHVTSRLVISCHVISRLVTSCHVTSCHVLSCHVFMSRIFLPSLLNSSIMAAGWPRRGFRNRGPVRESGSERRSRCGAARTASVRVWRRAHFCDLGIVLRGRLRGSGVLRACACGAVHIFATWASFRVAGCGDRACWRCAAGVSRVCRGCVAALCRGDWVPGAFFTRMVNVRFACTLRESCVLGGVPRVCHGRAGAPPIGSK